MNHPVIVYIVVFALPWTKSQFPKVCTTLDSLRSKECCPIPKGFSQPCGKDGDRGKCQELDIRKWTIKYSHYQTFHKDDDRHEWPQALYNRTCKCNERFGGYDCSRCEFGFNGSNCNLKKPLKRKNFLKLSDDEKDRYMKYVNMSKHSVSEYVVTTSPYKEIIKTVLADRDPKDLFFDISVYDYFIWLHDYAARKTIFPLNVTREGVELAHEGQGFLTWHRLFLLVVERTLQEVSNDEEFALPYWDWTENVKHCDVCNEELLGVTDQVDGIVKGKYLDDWYVICTPELTNNETELCDPTKRQKSLKRSTEKEKEEAKKNQGFGMEFPSKSEVRFALRFADYSLPPHSKHSSCNFVNILEGFASAKTGYRLPNVHGLHNQVHLVVGGHMANVRSATNDPIFLLHHSFVDRILEKWLRRFNKDANVLSPYDAPIGHNKDDVIVPLFPVYTHQQMFKNSFEFGYDYDDVDENGKSPDDEKEVKPISLGDCPVPCPGGESAAPGMRLCWWLMSSVLMWQLLLAD